MAIKQGLTIQQCRLKGNMEKERALYPNCKSLMKGFLMKTFWKQIYGCFQKITGSWEECLIQSSKFYNISLILHTHTNLEKKVKDWSTVPYPPIRRADIVTLKVLLMVSVPSAEWLFMGNGRRRCHFSKLVDVKPLVPYLSKIMPIV